MFLRGYSPGGSHIVNTDGKRQAQGGSHHRRSLLLRRQQRDHGGRDRRQRHPPRHLHATSSYKTSLNIAHLPKGLPLLLTAKGIIKALWVLSVLLCILTV